MRSAIKRGDYVTTIGGFRGRVVRVKDELITIEVGSDKTKLDIMRWGISKIDESAPERKSAKEEREEKIEEEEEQPKRKPKRLSSTPKKEQEPEEEDGDASDESEDDGEDEE